MRCGSRAATQIPTSVAAAMPVDWKAPPLLVVQDLFPTCLRPRQHSCCRRRRAFEKDGTFVNHAGLAQTFPRSVRPPIEVRTELQLAVRFARPPWVGAGCSVRTELSKAMPEFAALAEKNLPANGVRFELATL